MKPNEGNEEAISEYVTQLSTLQRNEGYHLLMAQVDALTKMAFGKLMAEVDPTTLAREVGKVAALREVRSWVDQEIRLYMEEQEAVRKGKQR